MLSLLLIVAVALAHSPLTHGKLVKLSAVRFNAPPSFYFKLLFFSLKLFAVGKLESTEQPEVTTKSEQNQQNVTGTGEDSLPIDLEELTGNNILEQPASTEQEQRATRGPEQTGTSGGEEHQGMTSDPEQSTASVEQERETPGNTELGATSTSERELATSSPVLGDTTDILEGERSREESETTEPKATTAARAGQTTRSIRCVPREELRPELQHQVSFTLISFG